VRWPGKNRVKWIPDFVIDGAWEVIHNSEIKCGCLAGQNCIIVPSPAPGPKNDSSQQVTLTIGLFFDGAGQRNYRRHSSGAAGKRGLLIG
jgi:hypothetical protein